MSDSPLIMRIVARYTKKREVPKATGKGTTTVYEYSDAAISKRNKDKAKRLEKLRGKIGVLRKKVLEGLKSSDDQTRLTFLAIACLDETAERIGNPTSAKGENSDTDSTPHLGVSGWGKKNITFRGKSKCTIRYTGKSGVKHVKEISDPIVVAALKKAYDTCTEGDLFSYEGGRVSASHVNKVLSEYDISAKDIRGMHANVKMIEALKSVRSKGGKLPKDEKERKKQLKDEFLEALEITAELVGNEPNTTRSQYLVPGLEDRYLEDGSVSDKLTTASVVARFGVWHGSKTHN